MIVFLGAQLFRARAFLFVFAALLASFFVGAPTIRAQCTYTQVTGTITDPNNIPYRFGDISVDLVSPGGGNPLCNGRDFPGHQGPTPLDSSGSFALTMPANTAITPGGTQWTFTVHSGATETWEPCSLGPVGFTLNVTVTGASQSVSSTLSAASKAQNLCGGSGSLGCAITGIPNLSVLSVHPLGTCYGSVNYTWDDGSGKQNLQAGLSNTQGTSLNFLFGTALNATGSLNSFSEGSTNTQNCQYCDTFGDNDTITQVGSTQPTEIHIYGESNTVQENSPASDIHVVGSSNNYDMDSNASDSMLSIWNLGEAAQITTNNGGEINVASIIGKSNSILATSSTSAWQFTSVMGQSNVLEGLSAWNHTIVAGDLNILNWGNGSATNTSDSVYGYGNLIQDTSGSNSVNKSTLIGYGNAISGQMNLDGLFGSSLTLAGCSHCYLFGENGNISATSNFVGLGLSATPEAHVFEPDGSHTVFGMPPRAFSTTPTCNSAAEGSYAAVTDSTTATNGATITGSGTHHVLGYCNGTNWLVAVGT